MTDATSFNVVIVGGGTAGITVAARLRKEAPDLKIAVLDPATSHHYQPPMDAGGRRSHQVFRN